MPRVTYLYYFLLKQYSMITPQNVNIDFVDVDYVVVYSVSYRSYYFERFQVHALHQFAWIRELKWSAAQFSDY